LAHATTHVFHGSNCCTVATSRAGGHTAHEPRAIWCANHFWVVRKRTNGNIGSGVGAVGTAGGRCMDNGRVGTPRRNVAVVFKLGSIPVCACVGWVGVWVGGWVCVCVWGGGGTCAHACACACACRACELYPRHYVRPLHTNLNSISSRRQCTHGGKARAALAHVPCTPIARKDVGAPRRCRRCLPREVVPGVAFVCVHKGEWKHRVQ
jgi:hypothetical protein